MSGFLIKIRPGHRRGRGTYWRRRGRGYTGAVDDAGVYPGEDALRLVHGQEHKYSVVADPMGRTPDTRADTDTDPDTDGGPHDPYIED